MESVRSFVTTDAMQDLEVAEFCQQLARMLDARVPADKAVVQAAEASDDPVFHQRTTEIAAALEGGEPLSLALAPLLGPLHQRILAAGESTDQVPAMLLTCAAHLRQRNRLTAHLRGMLGYPMIIAFAASGVLLFFLHFVFGEILPLMRESHNTAGGDTGTLPFLTQLMGLLNRLVPLLFVCWLLALGFMAAIQFGGERTRPLLAALCRYLPGYRQAQHTRDHARLSSLMASFIASGQPLPDALRQAVASIEDPRLGHRLKQAASEIDQGQQPGAALRTAKVDGLIPLLVDKANENELAKELHHLAELYTNRAHQAERAAHIAWTVVLFLIMVLWVVICLAGIITPILHSVNQWGV